MKRTARACGLTVLWLVVTFLFLEGTLRVLRPHHQGLSILLYIPSVQTHFDRIDSLEALLKDTVVGFSPYEECRGFHLNSRSFRTEEYVGEKRAGVYRIMAIGDSFVLDSGGVAQPDMWPEELEQELNRSWGGEVQAFAMGVSGVGPRFELRLWELEHPLVRPDLVVAAFFVGNDFTDEQQHSLQPRVETRPARLSYAYRLGRNIWRLWEARHGFSEPPQEIATTATPRKGGIEAEMGPFKLGPPNPSARWFMPAERRRFQICVKEKRDEFLELSADVGQVLTRFANEVRSSGQDFLVIIIPDEFQVNPELLQEIMVDLELRPEDVELDLPQTRLKEILDDANVPYLDLLPAFRERSKSERLYWPNNTHWNVEGHAFAAEVLARHLLANVISE